MSEVFFHINQTKPNLFRKQLLPEIILDNHRRNFGWKLLAPKLLNPHISLVSPFKNRIHLGITPCGFSSCFNAKSIEVGCNSSITQTFIMHKFDKSIDELLFFGIGFVVDKTVRLSLYCEL